MNSDVLLLLVRAVSTMLVMSLVVLLMRVYIQRKDRYSSELSRRLARIEYGTVTGAAALPLSDGVLRCRATELVAVVDVGCSHWVYGKLIRSDTEGWIQKLALQPVHIKEHDVELSRMRSQAVFRDTHMPTMPFATPPQPFVDGIEWALVVFSFSPASMLPFESVSVPAGVALVRENAEQRRTEFGDVDETSSMSGCTISSVEKLGTLLVFVSTQIRPRKLALVIDADACALPYLTDVRSASCALVESVGSALSAFHLRSGISLLFLNASFKANLSSLHSFSRACDLFVSFPSLITTRRHANNAEGEKVDSKDVSFLLLHLLRDNINWRQQELLDVLENAPFQCKAYLCSQYRVFAPRLKQFLRLVVCLFPFLRAEERQRLSMRFGARLSCRSAYLKDDFIDVMRFCSVLHTLFRHIEEVRFSYAALQAVAEELFLMPSHSRDMELLIFFPVCEFNEGEPVPGQHRFENYVRDLPLFYSFFDILPRLMRDLNESNLPPPKEFLALESAESMRSHPSAQKLLEQRFQYRIATGILTP